MSAPRPIDLPATSLSSSSLGDAVASYRRAQTFLSGSNITTRAAFPAYWRHSDEESIAGDEDEDDDEFAVASTSEGQEGTPQPNAIVDPLWDGDFQPSRLPCTGSTPNERTPILADRTVTWNDSLPRSTQLEPKPSRTVRKASQRSINSKYYYQGGSSTYRQTLFNSIAILLGIGMLSEPLAFAYAGWVPGTLLIIFYGFITCYTAKILARIILEDPSLRTYADIGFKAFGRRSTILTGLLFSLELFAVSVVLVTLYGDSVHLVLPGFSSDQYKILGLLVIIPTVFMPLSFLSYASILGILSTILIICCIVIDGLSKRDTPGSLWQPAPTDLVMKDARKLGVAFGLFMAGFGGHAVIPSLARDMRDPSQFDQMINWAFGVATTIYGMIGGAGYLMFGNSVSEEITRDILATPGYTVFLNKLAVWMLVIATLSKFALSTRPLNIMLEIWLGIDKPVAPPSPSRPVSPTAKSAAALATSPQTTNRPLMLIMERIALTFMAVSISILVPQFSTVMAFLGSFSAFVLCVIGPICAKVAIQGRCAWYDGVLLAISTVFTVWGTAAAFH